MSSNGSTGNVIAALCNFFIPGLGQLIQGRLIAAILFFIFTSAFYGLGYLLIVPWIIALPLHIWCIIDSAKYKAN